MVNRLRVRLLAAPLVLAVLVPSVFAAEPLPGHATVNTSALKTAAGYDRFIVVYRVGTAQRAGSNAALQSASAAIKRSGKATAAVTVRYGRKLATGADLLHTSRKLNATESAAFMQQLATDSAVAHVEPDVRMRAITDIKPAADTPVVPNDQYFVRYQWHLRPGTGTVETIGSDTTGYANKGGSNVSNAWNLADGTGVVVAVLDTGITQHPDIDLSLADAGYDFIIDHETSGRTTDGRVAGGYDLGDWTTEEPWLSSCTDANNPPEPSSWHGTHVSGTVAELTNNTVGMAGVAFGAKVLPVRVLGHCGGFTSDIADAITWASGGHVDGVPDNTHPAQIINMSLGGGGACTADDVTGVAIADAIGRGTSVVVAAGNDGADAANFSPASCPGAIAVASNGITGKRAFYSNYGPKVALSAPGGGIYPNDASSGSSTPSAGFVWSAINDGETVPTTADYGGYAGTSQATPHVAGTIALILSAASSASLPTPTPDQLRTLLTSTARAFPSTPDKPIGAGIVDADAAAKKVLGLDGGGPGDPTAVALGNGVALGGQSGAIDSAQLYTLEVPAGARSLSLRTYGGTGDVSVYVKAGSAPTAASFDFKSAHVGNTEAVVIAKPQTATYYVLVVGTKAFSGLSVLGTYLQ